MSSPESIRFRPDFDFPRLRIQSDTLRTPGCPGPTLFPGGSFSFAFTHLATPAGSEGGSRPFTVLWANPHPLTSGPAGAYTTSVCTRSTCGGTFPRMVRIPLLEVTRFDPSSFRIWGTSRSHVRTTALLDPPDLRRALWRAIPFLFVNQIRFEEPLGRNPSVLMRRAFSEFVP